MIWFSIIYRIILFSHRIGQAFVHAVFGNVLHELIVNISILLRHVFYEPCLVILFQKRLKTVLFSSKYLSTGNQKRSMYFSYIREFWLVDHFSAVRHANLILTAIKCFENINFNTFMDLLSSQSWLNYFSSVIQQQRVLYRNRPS